jgi:hypothetical protein
MNDDIKGPWVAEHLTKWSRVVAYKAHEPHEGCPGSLVIVHVDGKPEIRKEIANLISAAPELLDACKEMLNEMRAYVAEDEHDDTPNKELFDILKAAIAKAEGKGVSDV